MVARALCRTAHLPQDFKSVCGRSLAMFRFSDPEHAGRGPAVSEASVVAVLLMVLSISSFTIPSGLQKKLLKVPREATPEN